MSDQNEHNDTEPMPGLTEPRVREIAEQFANAARERGMQGVIAETVAQITFLDARVGQLEKAASDAARIDRLATTVRKLAGWAGHDIADLIDEGYLEPGDL